MREAAGKGAEVVLPPELFEGPYFCRVEDESLFATARPTAEHPSVLAMQALAAELKIWIPTSFFELDGPHHYNSLAMIGPDGKVAGVYRKSHIPDGPGYEEKFYFRPGNTGFKVWHGPRHVDARRRRLLGPMVSGNRARDDADGRRNPVLPDRDRHRAARPRPRHLAAVAAGDDRPCGRNVVPVVAANRIGTEHGQRFYGHSFICDERGDILAEFGAEETGVLVATLDLAAAKKHRAAFGFFRDRRPELYGRLVEDI